MTKLLLSASTISTNDNTYFLSFMKRPHLKVNIRSVCSSEGHIDSGYEDSATSTPVNHSKISEPAVQKLSVHLEESISEDLLNELFTNGNDSSVPVAVPQRAKVR